MVLRFRLAYLRDVGRATKLALEDDSRRLELCFSKLSKLQGTSGELPHLASVLTLLRMCAPIETQRVYLQTKLARRVESSGRISSYETHSGFCLDFIHTHLSICPSSRSRRLLMFAPLRCSCSELSRLRVELEATKTRCLKAETDRDNALLLIAQLKQKSVNQPAARTTRQTRVSYPLSHQQIVVSYPLSNLTSAAALKKEMSWHGQRKKSLNGERSRSRSSSCSNFYPAAVCTQ